jgi:hypothetical protein
MGLYDSDTGASLTASVVQDLDSPDDPIELWFCRAERGPIVQVRYGCRHIHYFYGEEKGRQMICEDECQNGVSLETILAHAPKSDN